MKRYLEEHIIHDLKKKMVFIGWPRQVWKTTLSKNIAIKSYNDYTYLNWDNLEDKRNIIKWKYKWWSELIIFDEIHKYENWKNFIKWEFDKNKEKYDIIVTWSARLDIYQKWWDSLLWRYFYYRLHPLSLAEISWIENDFFDIEVLNFRNEYKTIELEKLLKFWGFPEVFYEENIIDLKRWHNDRLIRLIREDIRDLSNIKNISTLELMVSLIPERIGSLFSINSLVEDLWVTHKTISNWVEILEKIYYSYRIYPFLNSRIRSVKKEPKLYLWDWSELKDDWKKAENIISGHLLKYVHYLNDIYWEKAELYYLRDREQREVDFCIAVDKKIKFLIEVKLKSESISKNLKYFSQKLWTKNNYQVIVDADKEIDYEEGDIRVISASKFLTALV